MPRVKIQGGEKWDEQAGGFFDGKVTRDALDHQAVVEGKCVRAGDLVGSA